jgi:FkbM family methyltransferase
MINDYSQHGEGKIVSEWFGKFKGNLLSIGENDGKTLSNVLGLIEAGWSGDLFEPCLEPFSKLEALHFYNEKIRVWKYAISNETGIATIFKSGSHLGTGDTALLSTLKEEEIKRWKGTCTFVKEAITTITWKDYRNAYNGHSKYDFVSIDAEGMDFEILKQLDLKELGVRCLCIETNSYGNKAVIDYMFARDYSLLASNFCNLIFVDVRNKPA